MSKNDDEKPRYSTVLGMFPMALAAVNEHVVSGIRQHGPDNPFLHLVNAYQRYTEALLRHVVDECAGISADESGDDTYASVVSTAANALIRLELYMRRHNPAQTDMFPVIRRTCPHGHRLPHLCPDCRTKPGNSGVWLDRDTLELAKKIREK